jgi:3-dehydroquinate dehydratase-1
MRRSSDSTASPARDHFGLSRAEPAGMMRRRMRLPANRHRQQGSGVTNWSSMTYQTGKIAKVLSHGPLVAGSVHSLAGLRSSRKLPPGAVDLIELRIDAFSSPQKIAPSELRSRVPLILTIRDIREGGAIRLSPTERREIFGRLLPVASMIDLELRAIRSFSEIIGMARQQQIGVIGSFHNFRRTPSLAQLRMLLRQAAGCDLLKIAVRTDRPRDLSVLLQFLERHSQVPLAVMGMGRFGKISRLLCAHAGSVLNYGYLDRPQVEGQWPAPLLKKRIAELSSSDAAAC